MIDWREMERNRLQELRGLLLHGDAALRRRTRIHGSLFMFGRSLIEGTLPNRVNRVKGLCVWCRTATTPRRWWHDGCVQAFLAAKAQTTSLIRSRNDAGYRGGENEWPWPEMNYPYLPPYRCAECGAGDVGLELDHRDALALAWATLDRKRILLAYSLDNLQWLCSRCHRVKTALDLQLIAAAKKGQVKTALDLQLIAAAKKGQYPLL